MHLPKDPENWVHVSIEKVIKTIDSIKKESHIEPSIQMVKNMHQFFIVWSPKESQQIKNLLLFRIEMIKNKL